MNEHDEARARLDNDAYVRAVHDKGLQFDLRTMSRRKMLLAFGGVGAAAVVGGRMLTGGQAGAAVIPAATSCATEIESETAGPYPADGSNGPQVRTLSGIVRSDIRTSFAGDSGTATGVPLTISMTLNNLACTALPNVAVYLWHCDAPGRYSLYSSGVTNQNYLRGIQQADASGKVTFTSIYPGCYSGRWPHIHFEVYSSLANATSGSAPIVKTSQIALPQATSAAVYATSGYGNSTSNLSRTSLASDMVFGDDLAAREMATMTGSTTSGYTAALAVTVNA